MLNQAPEAMALYRAATDRAVVVAEAVRSEQLALPTPCSQWTVQQLIDHMVGGTTTYLLSAVAGHAPVAPTGMTGADYRRGVERVLDALEEPGAMERMCMSPLGFEWSAAQAVAGTFMDVLIHTWDLARATGQDDRLGPDLVDACAAMFLPEMPERGRAAGIIGPAVEVGPDATPQQRLLAAMGRNP